MHEKKTHQSLTVNSLTAFAKICRHNNVSERHQVSTTRTTFSSQRQSPVLIRGFICPERKKPDADFSSWPWPVQRIDAITLSGALPPYQSLKRFPKDRSAKPRYDALKLKRHSQEPL